jgi:UMF1 family MFS transporter
MAEPTDGGRLGRFGWAMFDWANQPLFTLISTFIFAPYFTATVVGDSVRGQALWGYAIGIAGFCIAVLSPIMGAIADQTGPRKPWIAGFQVICVLASALLWFATPMAPPHVLAFTLAMIILLTIGAECSIVFNNAMLPHIVPPERIGRLSGSAWALGYIAGLATLGVMLGGFTFPEQPWFGLDKQSFEHARIVGPLTALWIVAFVAPLFLFTPDQPRVEKSFGKAAKDGIAELVRTLGSLRQHRNIAIFLAGRMASYDGLNALFAFGGIYAAGIFGWSLTEIGVFGILLNIVACLGAWAGGKADDRFGSKITIQVATLGLMLAALGIVSQTTDTVFFGLPVDGPKPDDGLFASTAERIFLSFGVLIGLCGGPMQAASRTMVARLSPPDMLGAFFGLHALSGKATAFLAPLAIAMITSAYTSQRAGISVILVFLVVGYLLTTLVVEKRPVSRA